MLFTENSALVISVHKELIDLGASIEVYYNHYNTNSLLEMAKVAKKKEVNLKIHVRNSELEDLKKILDEGKNTVTFIFD